MASEPIDREIRTRSRRSFLLFGAGALGGLTLFEWLSTRSDDAGALWPLRCVLEANERIGRSLFDKSRLAPQFPVSAAGTPRANGDIGLAGNVSAEDWRLQLRGGTEPGMALTFDAIKAFPRVEMVTELKCIEGWSQVVQWAGIRFSDFVDRFGPSRMTEYVAMATPNNEYYVGLDADSALHAQTLLAYEMNGAPLTSEHGAPLRLVIPAKYGIKNIKRIGSITFTNRRPADYWAEQGYDWYAGH
jgi:DMSO/TMAO reductase YedYZ molybdopterin-dependent catalytic subunit